MKLQQAFNLVRGDVVAFVGAGGKTSTLVNLGYELAEAGWRVLATTTTRIGENQLELMPYAMKIESGTQTISSALNNHRFVFLYDSIRQGKVVGLSLDWIPLLLDSVDSDILLVEADSAHGLPLKAPYADEPVLPPETTLVVPVASLSVLGQPLDDEHVYNAKAICERFGFFPGSRVKSPWVAQILRDDALGLRYVPEQARVIAFLNQVPVQGYLRGRGRLIARLTLRSPRVHGVALGSARGAEPVHEVQRPVGAVVLAAGMSTRMGQMKVLLPWTDGKTIIEYIIEQLIMARIDHIMVVTGHQADEVKQLVTRYGVKIVHNRKYKTGEMLSSLKAGLKAMPSNIAASLVVLGDQPQLQPKVIYQVMMAYAEGMGEIIAPSFKKQRGHPILIDRRYWAEILDLPKGGAPRDVINAHQDRLAHIEVDTDSVIRDLDTPQDYADARWQAGLK